MLTKSSSLVVSDIVFKMTIFGTAIGQNLVNMATYPFQYTDAVCDCSADTWRNNNMITSKRRCDVVLT